MTQHTTLVRAYVTFYSVNKRNSWKTANKAALMIGEFTEAYDQAIGLNPIVTGSKPRGIADAKK